MIRIVRADAILPGDEGAIRDGALVLDAAGTILDVGTAADVVPRHAGAPIETVKGVLLPGLVNAHTHVELSALRGKVSGGHGFVPWVDRMMGLRASERPEEDGEAIDRAVGEMDQFGTALVGEVTNTLAGVAALARRGIGGAIFHEVFGLDRERALAKIAAMADERTARAREWPADLVASPAPHTVYTTHPDAVRAVMADVRERGGRTSVHLAEHPAERNFLLYGSGPFADLAMRMRFPIDAFPVPHAGPISHAENLGLLAPDVLLVHLTDARADELDRVAASGAPVVLCPRSNLFIEVKLPPLLEMLKAGVVPALGTDSLASNASLDVLAEARALADRFPSVDKLQLVTMATAAGARALGRADMGRLAPGTRPGVLAVEGSVRPSDDPSAFVIREPANRRRWIARRSPEKIGVSP